MALVCSSVSPPKECGDVVAVQEDAESESTHVDTDSDSADATDSHAQVHEFQFFEKDETVLFFDWDDTVLPSTWVQQQGLRLDGAGNLTWLQREQLRKTADAASETLRLAKQLGTVILVTNAERGWIELSCQKFLPTLFPSLESVRMLSARTAYETAQSTPLEWKLRAFDREIHRVFGAEVLAAPSRRKNVLSFGDSVHEREAVVRATAQWPNCRSKSLKFVEQPHISQIYQQHELISTHIARIVDHDGNLDFCVRCPAR